MCSTLGLLLLAQLKRFESSGVTPLLHVSVSLQPLQIPLASPSGTLSTIASGTTVSVAESPVGGSAQSTSLQLSDSTLQQV
jgi:hypothetical protein